MSPRRPHWRALLPAAVLAALAMLAIMVGAFLLNRQLRHNERQRAVTEGRLLAFGTSRQASENFWRVREEFIFSLTNLPYERLLDSKDIPPEVLVPIRRFLALNQNVIRELVVTRQDGTSRSARINAANYFALSPLAATGLPGSSPSTVTLSGVVQAPDGSVRATVTAVVDPLRFWRDTLTTFSLSHPGLWIQLIDSEGTPVITRHGGAVLNHLPVLTAETRQTLREDAREAYEGRLFHTVALDDRSLNLISAYVPSRIEDWRGLLMVSADEQVVLGEAGNALGFLAAIAGVLLLLLLGIFFLLTRQTLRNQTQLEDSRRRIETVLNTVQSGILLVHSHTGRVTEVNASALSLLGSSNPAEILGQRIETLLPAAVTGPAVSNGSGFEARIHPRSGQVRHVLANTGLLDVAGGNYLLCSFVDITPLKETESRLQETLHRAEQSARDAEAANRAKSAFLAMMSHELRTPLNSILGLSESLLERIHGPLSGKQERYLQLVLSSGRHLLALINDILDLAKIESGREELNLTPCVVRTLCMESLQIIQPMATQRKQSLAVDLPDTDLQVAAEPRRLQQILVNLLGNAVKFTPAGGALGLRVTSGESGVRLCVWDRGPGISAADHERIFKPFVQLDARLAREYGGTGLGLALVKQLVSLHHGRIELESSLGGGASFTVILPRHVPLPAPPPPAPPVVPSLPRTSPDSSSLLVLIVEDTPLNVVCLRDFLEARGCRVEVAENGASAVDKTVLLHPDAILMDIQMPVLDGIQATRRIRRLADPALARTPIIAVTALAMPGDREQCEQAGADDYLAKPYSLVVLHERLLSLVAKSRAPA